MKVVFILISSLYLARANASPGACASCHRAETAAFAHAGMTRALERGNHSAILQANPSLTANIGGYTYRIVRATYTVTDGKQTIQFPIDWAFGQGAAGQTYVFEREGRWYESRVSYYSALRGLDLTMGAQTIAPHNLLEAAGRLLGPGEAGQCFDCHATSVVKAPRLTLSTMIEGVQCERCHVQAHNPSVSAGEIHPVPKLGAFTTEEMSDFCGQCHRTWSQIAASGPRGIQNVRFQPYRLGNSKCYDAADRRIRCTVCHNPHRDVEPSARVYDAKCVACHSPTAPSTKASSHICRIAAKDCVTCHMPLLDLPGAHKKFTDHMIRIVKANQPYPD